MVRFIRLKNMVLNTNFLYSIKIEPEKYYLKIVKPDMKGFMAMNNPEIFIDVKVRKDQEPGEYKAVTELINKYTSV